jgi:hypothetical protein
LDKRRLQAVAHIETEKHSHSTHAQKLRLEFVGEYDDLA